MIVGSCASLPIIQNCRKWPKIVAQYQAHVARCKKDAKLYSAKGSLNVDNINGSS